MEAANNRDKCSQLELRRKLGNRGILFGHNCILIILSKKKILRSLIIKYINHANEIETGKGKQMC